VTKTNAKPIRFKQADYDYLDDISDYIYNKNKGILRSKPSKHALIEMALSKYVSRYRKIIERLKDGR